MKHLIKKLLREGLLGESEKKTAQEVGLSGKMFYHGTKVKIDKLDPMFRQNNKEVMKGKRGTGSSRSGVGTYFSPDLGFDPNNLTYTDDGSVLNTGGWENAYKWAQTGEPGYIYGIKLKPTANIVDASYDIVKKKNNGKNILVRNIIMDTAETLIKNGVDAVWDTEEELVLLNPEGVESFKLLYKVESKYHVGKLESGAFSDFEKGTVRKSLDKKEVESYLKELLGDEYKEVKELNMYETMYSSNPSKILAVVKEVPMQIITI